MKAYILLFSKLVFLVLIITNNLIGQTESSKVIGISPGDRHVTEPMIAVNPTDPNNFITVYSNWIDSYDRRAGSSRTTDGGLTWSSTQVPSNLDSFPFLKKLTANRYADELTLGKNQFKTVSYKGSLLVTEYHLSQNYPNPFNPSTIIKYQLLKDGFVSVKVYDIIGREVATLVNENQRQGKYEINFDASKLSSGVYLYRLQSGDFVSTRKMLLLK